jgi:TolB-like protein/tetratricopeptide (TPR) repeat protein
MAGDFARKLGVVLKAINLSRGRLAQTVGVDKSVVSRWASGVQVPSDHNLSLLTEAVARHRPGFERRDWDLDAEGFANRFDALDAGASSLEGPSIAVLPFENMSGDPEQEYFADGMVEDIITALSRFKSMFVIARNSTFTYKGKAVDVRQVGRELGVRYVLEGSVRKAGQRVRISGQLVECQTGVHLWADRFDGSLADVFDLQDRVATSVVSAVAPRLDRAEFERARRKRVGDLTAYDCFLRGFAFFVLKTRESLADAIRLWYRAIELDPALATPYGMIALTFWMQRNNGWSVDQEREDNEIRRLALMVSANGGDDALALCAAGDAVAFACGEYEAGVALIDRGLSVNPNLAMGWRCRGWMSVLLGQHQSAIDQLALALRLSPIDPLNFMAERGMAVALLSLDRYDEAASWAVKTLAQRPGEAGALRTAAAAKALAGRIDDARSITADLLQLHPHMRLSGLGKVVGLGRKEDVDRLFRGLRLAGMPE